MPNPSPPMIAAPSSPKPASPPPICIMPTSRQHHAPPWQILHPELAGDSSARSRCSTASHSSMPPSPSFSTTGDTVDPNSTPPTPDRSSGSRREQASVNAQAKL
ncbi:hypothetical protein ACLOJK_041221 [Asimina triloba]